jgi:hypothetical protein
MLSSFMKEPRWLDELEGGGDRGSIPDMGNKFPLIQSAQVGSGTRLAAYSLGYWA